jgi:Na+/H+ antiporter NhaA
MFKFISVVTAICTMLLPLYTFANPSESLAFTAAGNRLNALTYAQQAVLFTGGGIAILIITFLLIADNKIAGNTSLTLKKAGRQLKRKEQSK